MWVVILPDTQLSGLLETDLPPFCKYLMNFRLKSPSLIVGLFSIQILRRGVLRNSLLKL